MALDGQKKLRKQVKFPLRAWKWQHPCIARCYLRLSYGGLPRICVCARFFLCVSETSTNPAITCSHSFPWKIRDQSPSTISMTLGTKSNAGIRKYRLPSAPVAANACVHIGMRAVNFLYSALAHNHSIHTIIIAWRRYGFDVRRLFRYTLFGTFYAWNDSLN